MDYPNQGIEIYGTRTERNAAFLGRSGVRGLPPPPALAGEGARLSEAHLGKLSRSGRGVGGDFAHNVKKPLSAATRFAPLSRGERKHKSRPVIVTVNLGEEPTTLTREDFGRYVFDASRDKD